MPAGASSPGSPFGGGGRASSAGPSARATPGEVGGLHETLDYQQAMIVQLQAQLHNQMAARQDAIQRAARPPSASGLSSAFGPSPSFAAAMAGGSVGTDPQPALSEAAAFAEMQARLRMKLQSQQNGEFGGARDGATNAAPFGLGGSAAWDAPPPLRPPPPSSAALPSAIPPHLVAPGGGLLSNLVGSFTPLPTAPPPQQHHQHAPQHAAPASPRTPARRQPPTAAGAAAASAADGQALPGAPLTAFGPESERVTLTGAEVFAVLRLRGLITSVGNTGEHLLPQTAVHQMFLSHSEAEQLAQLRDILRQQSRKSPRNASERRGGGSPAAGRAGPGLDHRVASLRASETALAAADRSAHPLPGAVRTSKSTVAAARGTMGLAARLT